jgi:acyl-CoA dehydrogenase
MGKAIYEHQAVSFMIADMAIGYEAARGLVYKSAEMRDRGERDSIAKAFASMVGIEVDYFQSIIKRLSEFSIPVCAMPF